MAGLADEAEALPPAARGGAAPPLISPTLTDAIFGATRTSCLIEPERDYGATGTDLFSSDRIEFYALRQRQCPSVIDRIRRAAHVGFPGVASRFPAASGFLLAAESPANLCSGRAYIDVGDAAVRPARRKEDFGFAEIIRKDRRRKTLRNSIMQLERRVQTAVLRSDGRIGRPNGRHYQ